eukprot:scaffold15514_cov129-Cylindrotheca_fusiformis.AAC.27
MIVARSGERPGWVEEWHSKETAQRDGQNGEKKIAVVGMQNYTECGDRTHDHTIKSRALYRLS